MNNYIGSIRRYLAILLLAATLPLSSQTSNADVIKSIYSDTAINASITIEVVDIITRKHVNGCTATFSDTSGRPLLVIAVDSIVHEKMVLKPEWYSLAITKPGYDTLVADWHLHPMINELYFDFYMRKEHFTKAEKKEAALKSQNVPSHRPEITNQGGFQRVGPGKREILEWKVEEYGKHGMSGSVHSSLKLKYLD